MRTKRYNISNLKEGVLVILKSGMYKLIPHSQVNNSFGMVTFDLYKGEEKVYDTSIHTPYLDTDENEQVTAVWDYEWDELVVTVLEGA